MSDNRRMTVKGLGSQWWLSPDMARSAMEVEQTYAHGRALGMDEAQIKAIVTEWSRWYQSTPWPISWSRVRAAITKQAMDQTGPGPS